MILSSIYIYPVKSLGGIKINSSEISERGLKYDRRWMIVDEQNRFVTQRTHPRLSLIDILREDNNFILNDRGGNEEICILPLELKNGEETSVVIWDDETTALYNEESSRWISGILGGSYRFVYMPDKERRRAGKSSEHIVSFADAYPFLIIGQSSLDDLNSRLKEKMEMIRFRPNFVFTGGTPFEEDTWGEFSIGEIKFTGVKPCSRCAVPTINPLTGESSVEPTQTLSKYRKENHKVYFGMNLISHSKKGKISVGDKITVFNKVSHFKEIAHE